MATFFRHDLRVLPCDTCGAPLEGAKGGGRVACRYCGSEQELTPREETPLLVGPRLSETDRLARLRQEDAFTRPVPEPLRDLVFGDRLVPWEVPEALARWQMARRVLASGGRPNVEEELFVLSQALTAHFERQSAWLEARAIAEGGLEELTEPRHRQVMRSFLARAAALTLDVAAAEAWLSGCDSAAAELESDGAWRLARACIDTARGDFERVLHTLGGSPTDVPLPNELDPAAALLRANAWERLGRVDEGTDLLAHLAEHGGPVFHLKARELAERHPELQLARQSIQRAEPRISAILRARAPTVGAGLWGCFFVGGVATLAFTLLVLLGAFLATLGVASDFVGSEVLAAVGSATVLVLAFVSMLGTIFALMGAIHLRRVRSARRLESSGRLVPGVVVQRIATGNAAMGMPEVSVRVLVLDGKVAYLASTETYVRDAEAPSFAPRILVALRIDPDDAHAFALVF